MATKKTQEESVHVQQKPFLLGGGEGVNIEVDVSEIPHPLPARVDLSTDTTPLH